MHPTMSAQTSLHIAADVKNLAEIRNFVKETAIKLKVEPDLIFKLQLAVDEAATNIIVHGYQGKPGEIEIEMKREQSTLIICLRDQAEPFDPATAPAPRLDLPPEERKLGGLGVYLIKKIVDKIIHRTMPEGGNELTLIKKLSTGE
jgi:serine/threonine-protein kinase RsbW